MVPKICYIEFVPKKESGPLTWDIYILKGITDF